MDRTDPRVVLWTNVQALMRHRYGSENLTAFARDCGIGPGSASRLKAQETSVGLDLLQKIGTEFDVAPWQLLVPGMEPGNLPVIQPVSASERRLYARFLQFRKALENGDDAG